MEDFNYIKKMVKGLRNLVKEGQGILGFLAIFGIGFFVYLLLDYSFFLPSWGRILFLTFLWVISLGVGIKVLLSKFNPSQELEVDFPEFRGRLAASLSSYPESLGYSYDLISKIRTQTAALLKSVKLRYTVKRKLKSFIIPFSISWALVLITTVILPAPKSVWIKRFFIPNRIFLSFNVSPGDEKVAYGDSVCIKVSPEGVEPRKLFLAINKIFIPLHKESGFKTTIQPVTQDITYYAKLSDAVSDTHKILVIVRPYVKSLKLTYFFPAYTKIPTNTGSAPDIEALYGTRVKLEGKANISLKFANINFGETPTLSMEVNNDEFATIFRVTRNDTYFISLWAENGLEDLNSQVHLVTVWDDESPELEVLFPATDVELPATMEIPIIFHATDDYGISKSRLVSDKGEVLISNEIGVDTVIQYNWDLSDLGLLPGEILKYWIEVYDNDPFKGPKVTKSETFRIYFPRIEDIYREVASEQSRAVDELQNALETLKSVGERLEKIVSEAETNQFEWEDREEVKEIVEMEKEVERALTELAARIDELYKSAERAMWVDQDLMEKISELQNLLSELDIPELKEAMQKIEEALKENPELLAEALKNFQLTQEELRERVERTLELLQKLQKEQQLKSLAEEASRLEEWQRDINERTETVGAIHELPLLSEEERALSEDLADLAQELAQLAEEMPSLQGELTEEVARAGKILPQLQQASSQLAQSKKSQALQQDILEQLSELASNLNSMYQQMLQQGKSEVAQQIRKLEKELLFLSFEEEGLSGTSLEMALAQEALIKGTKNVLEELGDLMKLTPFISRAAKSQVLRASELMEHAKRGFEEKESSAKRAQRMAMTALNEAIFELMQSESALQSALSAYGFQELMQQLSQLTQQQQGLNQLIQSLFPLNLMPSELGQQLAQLTAQQQALSQELERIAEGLKGKVLGDLGGVAEEMEKIAKDLHRGITEEIIKRQEKILKHLLDAQKSIYTKKFSRRRISEPGENFVLPSPPPPELVTRRGVSQKDILKALRARYPREYERLIRAYFRALATE